MIIRRSSREQGSMLIMTVVISGIIGLTLASYLSMVQAQHLNVMRSQTWNAAIPACESGIEEALAHLNSIGDADRATNGWVLATGTYNKTNTIGGTRYEVSISSANPPVVTSYGYVPAPLGKGEVSRAVRVNTTRETSGMKGLVAKGSIGLGPGSVVDSYDSRVTPTYVAGSANSNAFVGAVGGNISGGSIIKGDTATGPGFTITSPHTGSSANDLSMSFPPVGAPFTGGYFTPGSGTVTVTNFSVSGTTITTNAIPSPFPASGVITNTGSFTNTSPPASGAYTTQSSTTTTTSWPGASVGTITTNVTAIGGQKDPPAAGTYIPPYVVTSSPTRYHYNRIDSYSYSVTKYVYNTVTYTYSTSTTNAVSTTTASYTYVLDSENYKTDSISMSGQSEMLVRGDAVLWVTDSFTSSGNARITILPGASLKLYVGDGSGSGSEIKISGNGVLNMAGDTEKMSIFGLNDCTVVKMAGNGAYVGTVYAPNAQLQGKGGGNDVDDFQGAAIVGSVSYNGHFNFHYDEKLGDNGGMTEWKIASWSEF